MKIRINLIKAGKDSKHKQLVNRFQIMQSEWAVIKTN